MAQEPSARHQDVAWEEVCDVSFCILSTHLGQYYQEEGLYHMPKRSTQLGRGQEEQQSLQKPLALARSTWKLSERAV